MTQWKERAERAEAALDALRNPTDAAINASFAGLIEDQSLSGQMKRRAEFKRRYLLVVSAIDAARGSKCIDPDHDPGY